MPRPVLPTISRARASRAPPRCDHGVGSGCRTHQDTSAALAVGRVPVPSRKGGLGSEGVFVGQDLYSSASFVFDPWTLYQRGLITAPNAVLAGIVGSGSRHWRRACIRGRSRSGVACTWSRTPKGSTRGSPRPFGGRAIRLGHGLPARLNPLDAGYRAGGLSDAEWHTQVSSRRRDLVGALAETVLDRPLTPVEHTAIDIALRSAVASAEVPILPMVVERMLTPDDQEDDRLEEDGRMVAHAPRRLVYGDLTRARPFDAPSTVQFDPTLPMMSLDLSRVSESNTLMSVLMTCCSAWMESALQDHRRRSTLGRVRRGVAADRACRAAAADGRAVAAGAPLRHREPPHRP